MKHLFLFVTVLFCSVSKAVADNIVVNDVTIPQGGQVELEIGFNFDSNKTYTGCQFDLELPSDVVTEKDDSGLPVVIAGNSLGNHIITPSSVSSGDDRFVIVSFTKMAFEGTTGILLSVRLNAAYGLEIGSVLSASVKNITFTTMDVENISFGNRSFTITIAEPADPRTVLDENSTIAPTVASNVDIRVKRTINADVWSSICLPFAMTEAQTKEVFGNDVELAEFTGADSEFDGDNVVGIKVNFCSVNSIAANTPYIIKVSSAVSEFTMDGVDITPDEDEAYIEFDNGKTGSRRVVYSGFYGTYHAETQLEQYTVFLSGGKFWYSAGLTTMKAFRAYFEFLDVLSEVDNAGVKMYVNIDDEETGIENVNVNDNSMIYDLSGRRVSKVQKGIYIINGKKILK